MTSLLATDLDRTLVYSRAALDRDPVPDALVAVERYRDADASWMTAGAAAGYASLATEAVVVPSTTRTPAQWRRVRLPGPAARFAVTANGGVLLVDGELDRAWQRQVGAVLAGVAPLAEVWDHAAQTCRPTWTDSLRNADDLFCYAVLRPGLLPATFVTEARGWAQGRGWTVSLQGRKLYWVPRPLTKSAAVAEVARRVGAEHVLAAGDSLLDADLLEAADAAIMARHGELATSGWTAPHVTVTTGRGAAAGTEIVRWFADHLVR